MVVSFRGRGNNHSGRTSYLSITEVHVDDGRGSLSETRGALHRMLSQVETFSYNQANGLFNFFNPNGGEDILVHGRPVQTSSKPAAQPARSERGFRVESTNRCRRHAPDDANEVRRFVR